MAWSLSKVMRIESGDVTITPNDLRPLLSYVGIDDPAEVADLIDDARSARSRNRRSWYQRAEFRAHLSDSVRDLLEYEAEAATIQSFRVFYAPAVLQTPGYTAALLADQAPGGVQALIEIRRRRRAAVQARLSGDHHLVLLDQSVFERLIGGPAVLAEQLRELRSVVVRGAAAIRMLPFDLDTRIANNAGFDLISVDGAGDVLYRENGTVEEVVEDDSTTEQHLSHFRQLWRAAWDEATTVDFIGCRIATLEGRPRPVSGRTA